MSYNKALVTRKQQAVIKSIGDLLAVLDDVGDKGNGNSNTIIGDDGSIMVLGIENNRGNDSKHVTKISLTITKLNQDNTTIRLVKKKPEKTVLKIKKKVSHE